MKQNLPVKILSKITSPTKRFMAIEAAGGIVLILTTILALILANSHWAHYYAQILHLPIGIQIGTFEFSKTFEHWVNDGLMAIFFFVIGIEIKREILIGELSSPRKAALPIFAALGGMIFPALIYALFNSGGEAAHGWGIPMATDIAFALGVLLLFGKRIPFALKVFLLALAIADDLGAVFVIAVFYTEKIQADAVFLALLFTSLIYFFRTARIKSAPLYLVLSILTWFVVLKSGIHATVAGVVLGFLTPLKEGDHSPLENLLHQLTPWVSFVIMPIFAFANTGVEIGSFNFTQFFQEPAVNGIILGLVLGKPLGIGLFSWLACKAKLAELPQSVSWGQIWGAGALGGIGFTMALFICHLSLKNEFIMAEAKLGILIASLLAAILGSLILLLVPRRAQ